MTAVTALRTTLTSVSRSPATRRVTRCLIGCALVAASGSGKPAPAADRTCGDAGR